MSEAAKVLSDIVLDAIRAIVRQEIAALNGNESAARDNGKPKRVKQGGLLTPTEAAERIGLSRSSILRMIAEGSLAAIAVRSGPHRKRIKVDPKDVEKFLIRRKKG